MLVAISCALFVATTLAALSKNAVLLKDIDTLPLRANAQTTSTRGDSIPQLTCLSTELCSQYHPSSVVCKQIGNDGRDAVWRCEDPSMPVEFVFGRIEVSCQGFHEPDDPLVLVGSCGLEFELALNPNHRPSSPPESAAAAAAAAAAAVPSSDSQTQGSLVGNDDRPTIIIGILIAVLVGVFVVTRIIDECCHTYSSREVRPASKPLEPRISASPKAVHHHHHYGSGDATVAAGVQPPPPPYASSDIATDQAAPVLSEPMRPRAARTPSPPPRSRTPPRRNLQPKPIIYSRPADTAPSYPTTTGTGASDGPGLWTGVAVGAGLGYLAGSALSGGASLSTSPPTSAPFPSKQPSTFSFRKQAGSFAKHAAKTTVKATVSAAANTAKAAVKATVSVAAKAAKSAVKSTVSAAASSLSGETHKTTAFASTKRR